MRWGPAGAVLLGAASAAAVGWLAYRHAPAPSRCAPGMVALGPRCCGEGQQRTGRRCTGRPSRCAAGMLATERGCVPARRRVLLTGGRLVLAPVDWEAAGHTRPRSATVASFAIDSHETTEQDWAECVRGGACPPAPARDEPGLPQVEVTAAEAERYCQWRGGALPTTDQLAFASVGPSGRRYPWGDTGLVCRRAAFGLASGPCARSATGPELAGSHPAGASPEGVFDLVGNVAEWTRPEGGEAAVRGGSWRDVSAEALHGWSERRLEASRRDAAIGWRCVYAVESGP